LIPPGNRIALEGALRKVISDASERQRLGAMARQTYGERFRFERMLQKTVNLYDTVVDNAPARRYKPHFA
jgi:glycosyltransferase involved in cell wall biosynthesis